MQASQRLAEATKMPVPASKKCGQAFEMPEPVSGRPGLAFGEPQGGYRQTDGQRDGQMDVQIPPVFYRTLSPRVPFGATAQKVVGWAWKRLALGHQWHA